MPYHNAFRHQAYDAQPDPSSYEVIAPGQSVPEDAAEITSRLKGIGSELRATGVRIIYLVHGTFTGTDFTGWLGQIQRFSQDLARRLQEQQKSIVDSLTGEVANYTEHYARLLATGINPESATPIQVRRFPWSSENHHLGRADGAVRLFVELADLSLGEGERVLLWGHSHAGNLFALLSHLIGASQEVKNQFFRAARMHYQRPVTGKVDLPLWASAERRVQQGPLPIRPDIVTFGTPIRYGWETAGYRSLTHFVYHRPETGLPLYQAAFPPTLEQIRYGSKGDFLQQIGIAGTNFPVGFLSWRARVVEANLQRLLQRGLPRRETWRRWKYGLCVPDEGKTLLVDYHESDPWGAQLLAGHGVYTLSRWLPFHVKHVVRELKDSLHDGLRPSRHHDGQS